MAGAVFIANFIGSRSLIYEIFAGGILRRINQVLFIINDYCNDTRIAVNGIRSARRSTRQPGDS